MSFDDARPAAFNRDGDGDTPTESDWLVVGDRRYKVFALPSRTPVWVTAWGYGGFFMSLVGLLVMGIANRHTDQWATRVCWQPDRWYNGRYRVLLQEDYDTADLARARSKELVAALTAGTVPTS